MTSDSTQVMHAEVDVAELDGIYSDTLNVKSEAVNTSYDTKADKEDSSLWGDYDSVKRRFPRCPSIMTKDAVDELLRKAGELGVDDVVFQGDERIYMKMDKVFSPASLRAISFTEVSEILASMHRESTPGKVRSGKPQAFAYSVPVVCDKTQKVSHVRFRVKATACQGTHGSQDGLAICMRCMASYPMTMDELKVPQGIRDLAFPASGIVIVTGETGSGKTTLLGSFIREKATQELPVHIVTYEDPIEYDYRSIPNKTAIIAQTEVGEMIGSFDDAIPDAMRRNPDIIKVGEVSEEKGIKNALLAGQSGHLVYTTVHAEGVAITFSRMVTAFPHEAQAGVMQSLIASTRGIIHQRLLNKKDGGRIPVQEWLEIGRDEREILLDVPVKEITSTLERLVEERGQPLLRDLESKKDLIDEVDYKLNRRSLIKNEFKKEE